MAPAPLETRPPTRPSRAPGLLAWLALAMAVLALALVLGWRPHLLGGGPPAEPRPVTPRGDLAADEKATIELFKQTSPSVVFITTLARGPRWLLESQEVPRGAGSGFVWDRDGHVVTNFHVIQGASAARVTLHDRSEWEASLVGVAPDQDLAVIRIRAPSEKLVPILVGSSRDLQVGQKVFAIGNPFGLDFTLTTGIVSAIGRIVRPQLGVTVANEEVLRRQGIQGLLIISVAPGSSAEQAGVRGTYRTEDGALVLGDIVQKLDGRKIASVDDLFSALERHRPGDTVKLTLLRQGKSLDADVVLEAPRQ